ncbi:hypothetical protein J5N97_028435 [Dioscorea zingiberensis]|uniref:Methyltransferase n=1 Tax=Dioscorea zingiberensis TaxID=325984 RepID=A0A9D5BYY1_9LILI|nr:hypothetical protein J5N97_028435 [Dioscorea zingiberensis]
MRFGRVAAGKRAPFGFCVKISMAVFLGLSFVVVWSVFSSPASSVSSQLSSFSDLPDPVPSSVLPHRNATRSAVTKHAPPPPPVKDEERSVEIAGEKRSSEVEVNDAVEKEKVEVVEVDEQQDEGLNDEAGVDADLEEGVDVNPEENGDEEDSRKEKNKGRKKLGPLFDSSAKHDWKLCGGSGWQNYVPCVDTERLGSGKNQRHRHHERSCPRSPLTCLVPLPVGYKLPLPWPERESKVLYRNVGHPKLSAFIKTRSWLNMSGEHLLFPQGESDFMGGAHHYVNSIEEMVPDIEWGKNIRIVLDVGCVDASFGAILLEKDVLTLSLGLMNDETDLAQLALERGIPAVVANLGTRRLPFPSGVFDAIHCGECSIAWHSSGGRLLLEMNRILRPGGYFIISTKHGDAESEEGMSTLMASICWNVLAHRTDEVSEVGVRIYQRPASNDIYDLRRRSEPPFCKEDENQDIAWYTPVKPCLHKVPVAIEERGSDWPEEWPKRLEAFPEWLGDSRAKLTADDEHWRAIINKSYLNGMGIDWTTVRNVMDMKAIYGGFAAALASQKVWVMNVVPVHAPNTLPIIYERGLMGIYHDWCEPFSTYPRSYDLLHADHLFSRLKNRCKQPISIIVEMDRILRPGGWAIIRDKLVILNPLEEILKSLHWEIRMTYGKDKEGIMCVQKTSWRP